MRGSYLFWLAWPLKDLCYLHHVLPEAADECLDLQGLASSFKEPADLAKQAYDLYSEFRPQIAQGQAGWGKPGLLDVEHIKALHN